MCRIGAHCSRSRKKPTPFGSGKRAPQRSLCAGTDADLGIALLADLRAAFGTQDRLTSDHIVKTLLAEEEQPWRHAMLNARALAQRLRPFGIRPRVVRTGDDAFARGYLAADFAEAFARYLPPAETERACVHA